jgi:signal transduction histidine kinase
MESQRRDILVVDDLALNLQLASTILVEHGYEVTCARSGMAALELARARAFDAILLDVQMPGIDGWEVCRILRSEPGTRDIPIIFMTAAYGDDEDVIKGLELGASDYVTKPVHPRILVQRVDVAVRAYVAARDQRILAEERAEALRALAEAQAGMLEARKLSALATMARGLAHEINNPLGAAMSNASFALGKDVSPEERASALSDAVTEMRRVASIVDRMRRLGAAIETDEIASVSEVVSSIVSPLADDLARRRVTLTARLESGATLWGAGRLGPVIEELISNAARAVRAGGRIEVATHDDETASVVTVVDDGAGMDADTRARAFEPFFTRKDDWRAVGLGLPMCHAVATALGGELSLDSTPEAGTRVTIRLPRLRA